MESCQAFAEALLLEDHLDQVVILPHGLATVGLAAEEALPPWLLKATAEPSVLRCLRSLPQKELSEHKESIWKPD